MITKGIIDKIEDSYTYRVRIPILDKSSGSPTGTSEDQLASALVSSSPGCKIYYQPGDVVFIAFEEEKSAKPVIIGQLYREEESTSQTVLDTTVINATTQAVLPEDTTIGEVSARDLSNVKNSRNNLQSQIDQLEERLSLFDMLPRIKGNYTLSVIENQDKTFSYSWSMSSAGQSHVGQSHVGMIIQSTTLDTEIKVINIYGGVHWEKIEGKFLLGQSESHEIGSTGGSETHTPEGSVGGHTLTVAEMPSHNHSIQSITGYDDLNFINGTGQFLLQNSDTTIGWSTAKNAEYRYGTTYGTTGGNGAHNHGFIGSETDTMPPYKTVYIWERTE